VAYQIIIILRSFLYLYFNVGDG